MWAPNGDWKLDNLSAAVHYHCEHGGVNEKNCWSYLQYLFSTLGGKRGMLICRAIQDPCGDLGYLGPVHTEPGLPESGKMFCRICLPSTRTRRVGSLNLQPFESSLQSGKNPTRQQICVREDARSAHFLTLWRNCPTWTPHAPPRNLSLNPY